MIERRDLLRVGVALAAYASVARAADEAAPKSAVSVSAASNEAQAFAQAIAQCITAGNACLDHCLAMLGSGDTSLAECSKAVRNMLAVCNATQVLVLSKPGYVKAAVQLCIDACTDCERACRKHAEHHAACKTCGDACAATVKAAHAYLA
ncbi:MAG TPA: Csp1 family four helix bundle copper storage protein [Candidatus Margulisiibacteriota bacterium]|nr:Csp1 family four helix bundle copper storage protein [Candidatus Margulisiibacteriota bacterium]